MVPQNSGKGAEFAGMCVCMCICVHVYGKLGSVCILIHADENMYVCTQTHTFEQNKEKTKEGKTYIQYVCMPTHTHTRTHAQTRQQND